MIFALWREKPFWTPTVIWCQSWAYWMFNEITVFFESRKYSIFFCLRCIPAKDILPRHLNFNYMKTLLVSQMIRTSKAMLKNSLLYFMFMVVFIISLQLHMAFKHLKCLWLSKNDANMLLCDCVMYANAYVSLPKMDWWNFPVFFTQIPYNEL